MKKFTVLLVLAMFLTGCSSIMGLNRWEEQEVKELFFVELRKPASTNRIANVAGEVMDQNYAAMWTEQFKSQPIVKDTIMATITTPLNVVKNLTYDMQELRKPIFFEFNSEILNALAKRNLQRKAEIMAKAPRVTLMVIGRASNTENYNANLALSQRRANVCKFYLIAMGVPGNRILTTHRGATDSAVALHEDQRVDFNIILTDEGVGYTPPPEGVGKHYKYTKTKTKPVKVK